MSIHPSLSSNIKGKHHRSVLKRGEKIKLLMKKGEWTQDSSVYGLPKIKITRLKIRKEKAAAEKVAAETLEAAATAEVKPTPTAEEQKKSKEKAK